MKLLSLAVLAIAMASVYAQQYKLVWSDEFNGDSLDLSKWQHEVNCDGGGNNEMQCYTNREKNVDVRNGSLVITALRENYNGKRYTSGRVNTKGKAAWKYGKFEVRAKVPSGIYLWPALWMMPRDSVYGMWAASGEIDIFEARGGQPTKYESTLHFGGGWPKNIYQGSGPRNFVDLTKDFHTYGAVWTPESIQFFFDGNNFFTMSLQRSFANAGAGSNPYTKNGQPFDQPFYFIINLAIGGGFFGGESQALTDAQARDWASPKFEIDYVRAYQLSNDVVNNPVPAPAPVPKPTTKATPTPAPTANNNGNNGATNNGGCAAGACGGAPCCQDQSNGQQCYNVNAHACVKDMFSQRNALCPKGFSACRGACFSTSQYACNNGRLSPK